MVFPLLSEKRVWVYASLGRGTTLAILSVGFPFLSPCASSEFLAQYITPPSQQGYLVDPEGNRLGEHNGLWHYTIGQGARLGGMLEPWFVAKKGVGETGQDIQVVPGS